MADKEQPKAPQVPAPAPAQAPSSKGLTKEEAEAARQDQQMLDVQNKKFNKLKPEDRLKKGGSVSSASSRADGIASRGKTRGTIVRMG